MYVVKEGRGEPRPSFIELLGMAYWPWIQITSGLTKISKVPV
jgi:hypothetical protein